MGNENNFLLRKIGVNDQDFLYEMLYQSIYVDTNSPPPDRDIIKDPKIRKYVENWGKKGDFGYIAIDNKTKKRIGAIWLRYFTSSDKGYGYIADNIPELGIAVDYHKRGQKIGSALLKELLNQTKYKIDSISLSVDPDNPAVRLYERNGFIECGAAGTSIIMRLDNKK